LKIKQNKNIAVTIERNLWDFLKIFSDFEDSYTSAFWEYYWLKTNSNDWPNFIYYLNLISINVQDLNRHFSSSKNSTIPSNLLIGPSSKPENIVEILIDNSYGFVDNWTGMIFEKDSKSIRSKYIEGLTIQKVNNDLSFNNWLNICKEVFFFNKSIDEEKFRTLLIDKRIKMYLGYMNGLPVASSLLFINSNSIGLYNIGTIKEYRKLGIGYNMTVTPITDLSENKIELPIILQSTATGESVYTSIGFRKVCDFYIINNVK
jgi:hypothetical protein